VRGRFARVLLLLAAVTGTDRAVAGDWSGVTTIAQSVAAGVPAAVAVDGAGNALVAWIDLDFAVAVGERATGQTAWQQRGEVGGRSATHVVREVAAALAADGSAIAAWVREGEVEFAYRAPGGTFAPPVRIPGSGFARGLQVALDPQGNAFLAWNQLPMGATHHALSWIVRTNTGILGPIRTLSDAGPDSGVRLGSAATGEVLAAFDAPDVVFDSVYLIGADVLPVPGAGSGIGQAVDIDVAPMGPADLAVGADGRAVIVHPHQGPPVYGLELQFRPPGGDLFTFVNGRVGWQIFPVPDSAQGALLSDGTALVAYIYMPVPEPYPMVHLVWGTFSPDGMPGPGGNVPGAEPQSDLDLVVDANDNGILVFVGLANLPAGSSSFTKSVFASVRPPSGMFEPARLIATPGESLVPRVATGGGTTVVVWNTTSSIESATYTSLPCGVRCVIAAAKEGTSCAGGPLPKALVKILDRAVGKAEAASTAPANKARRLRKAAGHLFAHAQTLAGRAARGRHPKLSPACAAELRDGAAKAIGLLGS